MDHDIVVEEWRRNAASHDDENHEFLRSLTTKEFAEAYLATGEFGDHKFRQQPCPFLGEDGRCRIYSVRPTDCREYPHTDKKCFTSRTITHANNALACPAVFWIVEQMRIRSRNARSKPVRSDSGSRG